MDTLFETVAKWTTRTSQFLFADEMIDIQIQSKEEDPVFSPSLDIPSLYIDIPLQNNVTVPPRATGYAVALGNYNVRCHNALRPEQPRSVTVEPSYDLIRNTPIRFTPHTTFEKVHTDDQWTIYVDNLSDAYIDLKSGNLVASLRHPGGQLIRSVYQNV